jgi:hypothetical protein
MGEQRNLTQENVEELTSVLEKMKKENKELEYSFHAQRTEQMALDAPDMITILKEIKDKVESLERKINLVFGEYVLINGSFRQITDQKQIGK